jgi:hypothetical protein
VGRLLFMPVHTMYEGTNEERGLQHDRTNRGSALHGVHESRLVSGQSKLLAMALPDQETLAFWKATEDYPGEYAARIAAFSRRVTQKE